MKDIIVEWLIENYPWMIPTAILCYMSWKVSRWSSEINHTVKKVDTLPCEEHLRRLDAHDIKIEREEDEIKKTNERIDNILLSASMGGAKTSRKKSPYMLNDFGEYVLSESEGDRCVEDNKDYLFHCIKSGLHSTPYDVERASLRAVLDMFSTDRADRVKDYIYNAPEYVKVGDEEYKMTQLDVQVAMAIYLRDMFLSEQSGKAKEE